MQILIKSLAILVLAGYAVMAQEGCDGVRNKSPVLDMPPKLLKTVKNGVKWLMKNDTNIVYIAKIKGTPYEMGKAYGELFADELKTQFGNIDVLYPSIMQDLLPQFNISSEIADLLDDDQLMQIANIAMDLNWKIASPFIPDRFVDEIAGISAGSGIDESIIRRANMLPEMTKAHCTVVGSWNDASKDNRLLHLRALDWEAFAPINQYPAIILYEPTEEGSKPFANIGYLGLIGTLTSMSKIGISAGEKVMIPNDVPIYPIPPETPYVGKPWMFVLRDTVQFSNNIIDVYNNLASSSRTAMIHGGWASAPENTFRGMNYAANWLCLYDDKNYTQYNPTTHPELSGVFFLDRHTQPSLSDTCLGSILKSQHGNITAETLYRDVVSLHETGDNNYVVMDPVSQEIWTAWS